MTQGPGFDSRHLHHFLLKHKKPRIPKGTRFFVLRKRKWWCWRSPLSQHRQINVLPERAKVFCIYSGKRNGALTRLRPSQSSLLFRKRKWWCPGNNGALPGRLQNRLNPRIPKGTRFFKKENGILAKLRLIQYTKCRGSARDRTLFR